MKTILFFLSLFISFTVSGIEHFDYRLYNQWVNKAELAIIESNYEQAEFYYQKAFSQNSMPQIIDVQNALTTAIINKNESWSFDYARKLATLGVGKPYFEHKALFSWLKTKKEWPDLLVLAKGEKEKIEAQNKLLLFTLRSRAKKYDEILAKSCEKGDPYEERKRLDQEKKTIEKELLQLFRDSGYLSEYKIGAQIRKDTILDDPIFTKIISQNYMDFETHEIFAIIPDSFLLVLKEEMTKGKVSTGFIIRIIPSDYSDSLSFLSFYRDDNTEIEFQKDTTFYNKLNTNRKEVGLCSYEEHLQKRQFNISNPCNPFLISPPLNRFKLESGASGMMLIEVIPECK